MPQSRRAFLRHAGFTAAMTNLGATLNANPLRRPIGLQLYTVSDELARDLSGTLRQVAAIGYQEVELAATYGKSATELRRAFEDAGLQCRSVHWFDLQKTAQQFIDFAKELGVKYVVTSFNPPPSALAAVERESQPDFGAFIKVIEGMTLDDYKQSAVTCNHLGELAKNAGLTYAYHNHNAEFKKLNGTLPYDLLLESTDPDLVKMEMDCGWLSVAGHDPVEYLGKYPNRFRLLHIKDFKAGPPSSKLGPGGPTSTELGRGFIDYKRIFAAASKANIEGYYVEQEPPFTEMPALEAIKVNYRYLNAMS